MSSDAPAALESILAADGAIAIVGCGGFGVMTLDAVVNAHPACPVVFIDDDPGRIGGEVHGIPVFGPVAEALPLVAAAGACCVVAIANNRVRQRIVEAYPAVRFGGVIHPAATISALAEVGTGCIVLPGVAVDPEARIGRFVVLNKLCSIGHNCVIEDFAQLAPLVGSGGHLGRRSFIGMGASILPGTTVGDDAVVGAGAVVTTAVAPGTTVVGAPARRTAPA